VHSLPPSGLSLAASLRRVRAERSHWDNQDSRKALIFAFLLRQPLHRDYSTMMLIAVYMLSDRCDSCRRFSRRPRRQ